MRKLFLLGFCLTGASMLCAADAYLFSYFSNKCFGGREGEAAGLHLAYSYDGKTWTALNNDEPVLVPEVGKDKLLRDPSVCQGPDGTFHMVWTTSWKDRIIGYASSKDLVHWSAQKAIPVMTHEPTARNCWAPELTYNPEDGLFYIYWATTIPGRHTPIPGMEKTENKWNHRIYLTTTKDFETFSPTRLWFNPSFCAIDAALVRDEVAKDWIMFVKNENHTPPEKNIRMTRAKDLQAGFPTEVSPSITPNWVEGPTPLFVGDALYVYFDCYTKERFGAVRSLDRGKTWTDVSDEVSFPKGIRHGTAFAVDKAVVDRLVATLPESGVPAWQAEARKAFGEQRFGIFIHWGLYAMYAQGEWYQTGGIPRKEYATAAGGFYPSRFDARKWVKAFKQAGAKYVTFTARHHDGFSLFHTKYAQDDYDIAHTPFKRDICKELADACHAEGLQMNFYYSLMDWWRTDYPIGKSSVALVDKELNANADYASYKRFMINQLGELLTNYGPVGCIWLDGEGDHRDGTEWAIPGGWQFEEIYDFIHSHHALVGNNNNRPTREKEDIQFFEMSKDSTIEGARANRADKPFERCFTMQKGIWGYQIPCDLYYSDSTSSVHVVRGKFHPKPYMLQMLVKNAAKGVNLLLNVGPRIDGELSDECYAILDYMGRWLAVNGESIYATEAGPAADGEKVVTTQTKDAVYVHFLDPTVKEFSFPFALQPVSVTALDGGAAVPFTAADGRVTVRPTVPADAAAWTVKVLFK